MEKTGFSGPLKKREIRGKYAKNREKCGKMP
jgi:hypothetical protein